MMVKRMLALLVAGGVVFLAAAQTRTELWKRTRAAMDQGLPKTAVTNLQSILEEALAEKDYPDAAKALALRCALEAGQDQENAAGRVIRLQAALTNSPAPMQPILRTILAHWLWNYYERHRWQFAARTSGAGTNGDFTTWDLPTIFGAIGRQFGLALEDAAALKAIPIESWGGILEKGTMPDAQRPTLYDFIAREAIDFYAESQRPEHPEKAFEIGADSPVFDSVEKFLAWQPNAADEDSPTLKALRLWQDLLRFHQNDPSPAAALAAADLDRIVWGWNVATGDDKDSRCLAALDAFIQAHGSAEISADARHRAAGILYDKNDCLAAHRLAAEGEKQFPRSPGGKLCHDLLLEIEMKNAFITTEGVWNAPWPKISVRCRNIDAVDLRAIPVDWEMFLAKRYHRPENLSEEEQKEILARKAALEWTVKLPARDDYTETNFDAPAPGSLKPGFYFLAASHKTNGKPDCKASLTPIWVSDLALTLRTRENSVEGFVTFAGSGEPITGAKISVWHLDRNGNRIADPSLASDANGFFSMNAADGRGYLFRARANGQEIAVAQDFYASSYAQPQPLDMVYFYTDRAIYRPGQTIQFKGVCLHQEPSAREPALGKEKSVTVVFADTNGKEISRLTLAVNDYGSFSGSFTAPRDRLPGTMNLSVIDKFTSQGSVRVEEYKRPKFETTLDAPTNAPKLNAKATLAGHATAYTGASVDGAAVVYRVTRQPRFPSWWGWWHPHDQYSAQEITHGTTTTAADGSFTIEFDALPDASISPTNEPVFEFKVDADVTDNAGETRSAERQIAVGYTALQADLAANDWETATAPVELKIATKTLDGEPEGASGVARVYALEAPRRVERPSLQGGAPDLPLDWPLGRVVGEKPFVTSTNGETNLNFSLAAGAYRAVLETKDRFGKSVTARLPLRVVDPLAARLELKVPNLFEAPKWEAQPGDYFTALWGTGYAEGRACVEVVRSNQVLTRYWTPAGRTQEQIKIPVTEAMRGGFTLMVTQVRENRLYADSRQVDVPWKNKELPIKWEHFTSKLQPGQKETWTAVITGPKAEKAVAEMVAALYDESLDAFAPLTWPQLSDLFGGEDTSINSVFANTPQTLSPDFVSLEPKRSGFRETYRHLPAELIGESRSEDWRITHWPYRINVVGYINLRGGEAAQGIAMGGVGGAPTELLIGRRAGMEALDALSPAPASMPMAMNATPMAAGIPPRPPAAPPIHLGQIAVRKNLNETAFFYPQLLSDSNGVVRLTFTMPEALTKWRFLAMAHDKALRSGFLETNAVTAKDLMTQPNPPRFLREGDMIEFSVKISNQSDSEANGMARLNFNDAATEANMDAALENTNTEQAFHVPARQSRAYFWRIHVPDGCGFLTYKAVAATDKLSDGEEGAIPVLSRRELVTESLPLPIRGPETNQFRFDKLADSANSPTLRNESLTVQMASNPAWYAVLALPYLMEFPHECNEQLFNRLYANALARHIANSDPKIRRIFDLWRNTAALDSPLEKNQDLKSVMIEETPWLRDAEKESEARRRIGVLFDANRLDSETQALAEKLGQARLSDGRWPWFPGGPGDDFITMYIVTGLGRLRHLGVQLDFPALDISVRSVDEWLDKDYDRVQRASDPDDHVPSALECLYLYGRSFFLNNAPATAKHHQAIEFMLGQARKKWLQTECRQSQGQLALALHRWGGEANEAAAQAIMKSLKERSASSEEMGMHWNDDGPSWWWYRAPIETQALMIEAFDEVAHDQGSVDDCRVWLLKQKQTQNWKTTKATADAVYAILLRGANLLASDALVQTTVGGIDITPARNATQPGTGFYEKRFVGSEITPALAEITIKKSDAGVAWGAAHRQYLEDIDKITPATGTPLKLRKSIWVKVNTARGPVLQPATGALRVGDELVVRLELHSDRDMEYLHLEDERGSGVEPVNVLSGCKYQDGLAYYEATRDTASHFFIDYLPKGSYVFEYSARVQLRGRYETGVAKIQCMYAPEFNSHSQSFALAAPADNPPSQTGRAAAISPEK